MFVSSVFLIATINYTYSFGQTVNDKHLKVNSVLIIFIICGCLLLILSVYEFIVGLFHKKLAKLLMPTVQIANAVAFVFWAIVFILAWVYIGVGRRQMADFCTDSSAVTEAYIYCNHRPYDGCDPEDTNICSEHLVPLRQKRISSWMVTISFSHSLLQQTLPSFSSSSSSFFSSSPFSLHSSSLLILVLLSLFTCMLIPTVLVSSLGQPQTTPVSILLSLTPPYHSFVLLI